VLNQGMPVKFPPAWRNESWAQATVKHHPRQPGEQLLFLSDIIILRDPYDVVMSFGDLIIAVGLCDVAYNASRDPRRRRRRTRTRTAGSAATTEASPAVSIASPQPTAV